MMPRELRSALLDENYAATNGGTDSAMRRRCQYFLLICAVTMLMIYLLTSVIDQTSIAESTFARVVYQRVFGPVLPEPDINHINWTESGPDSSEQEQTRKPFYMMRLLKSFYSGLVTGPCTKSVGTSSPASLLATDDALCKFPHLEVDDPIIKPYLKSYNKLQCSSTQNWVYTANGKFYISEKAEKLNDKIQCRYMSIYRKDDEHWDWTDLGVFANGTDLPDDLFNVKCSARNGTVEHENLHAGVAYHPELHNRTDTLNTSRLNMDVYIYLLDSMSRINFIRKLPKFYKMLTEKMHAFVMQGFNVVGDGTPWTMIPVTTGKFQTELYEARKRFSNASTVDGWPLIFKDFKAAGYVTSYAEEQAQYSFFSYKLKGFRDPPVDHYLRPFEQAVNWVWKKHQSYCLGDTPRSIILCKWWKEQQEMYAPRNIRTFSMLFSSETSHDDYNYVQVLDEHWEETFLEQYQAGYFNNTLLIIMGDHGRRFGAVRQTQSGKIEEKLPFLAVIVPEWFQTIYPESYANLERNTRRLVTPFDLHETLSAVINFTQDGGLGNVSNRGISLFQAIPAERTCSDAWIKPHFCTCLDWQDLSLNATESKNAVKYVIEQFNTLLNDAKNACVPLQLDTLHSAKLLKPSQSLMSFKESSDYDNIFPDLSASTDLAYVLYQLRFTTAPGGGDFEVSLTHFPGDNKYKFSSTDVSRINMYGEQPYCIMDSLHHLRQYCVCWGFVYGTNSTYGDFVPIASGGT